MNERAEKILNPLRSIYLVLAALFLLSIPCIFVHAIHQSAKIPVYFQIVAYNQAPNQDAANVKKKNTP
jgi:hypothetical protein